MKRSEIIVRIAAGYYARTYWGRSRPDAKEAMREAEAVVNAMIAADYPVEDDRINLPKEGE